MKRLQHIQAKLGAPALSSSSISEFGLQFQWYGQLRARGARVEQCDAQTEVQLCDLGLPAFLNRTVAADVKVCSNLKSMKHNNASRAYTAKPQQLSKPASLAELCKSGRRIKAAFVTPFPPRHDGLAQHAANLRNAMIAICPSLQACQSSNDALSSHETRYCSSRNSLNSFASSMQVDVFAIVLDFWNAEIEVYDDCIGE